MRVSATGRALVLCPALVEVKVRVRDAVVPVLMQMNVGAAAERPQESRRPEPYHHQRHAELQPARDLVRDGDPKCQHDDADDDERNRVAGPQSAPTAAERRRLRSWLTIVETATT